MRKKLGISFMILGITLLVFATTLLFYNNFEDEKAEQQANILVNSLMSEIKQNLLTEPEIDPFDEEMKIVDIDGYGYIGYLLIPDLNLELPVMDKWDYKRLKISPCRYYGSIKTDNLVIAAHNYKSHFKYIDQLVPGNEVIFIDMDGNKHVYFVTSIEILYPNETQKVQDTGNDLTLYTCIYSGKNRIVVKCNKT